MTVPDELEPLRAECAALTATLRGIQAEDWHRHALGEWDVHVLAAHLLGTLVRIFDYLDQPAPPGPVTTDRVRYYRYDVAEVAPGVAERAAERAAARPPDQMPDAFASLCTALERRLDGVDPQRLVPSPFGAMTLADYLATRCVEAVVHHMDLRRALDLELAPDQRAADLVADILDAMLDGDRPATLDRDTFILVATGRLASPDSRFPLLG